MSWHIQDNCGAQQMGVRPDCFAGKTSKYTPANSLLLNVEIVPVFASVDELSGRGVSPVWVCCVRRKFVPVESDRPAQVFQSWKRNHSRK
jgi:hypothetical protein